jgi:hypothetical protein
MSEEGKICPFMSTVIEREGKAQAIMVECKEQECRSWREIDHNDWDCALIRNGKK